MCDSVAWCYISDVLLQSVTWPYKLFFYQYVSSRMRYTPSSSVVRANMNCMSFLHSFGSNLIFCRSYLPLIARSAHSKPFSVKFGITYTVDNQLVLFSKPRLKPTWLPWVPLCFDTLLASVEAGFLAVLWMLAKVNFMPLLSDLRNLNETCSDKSSWRRYMPGRTSIHRSIFSANAAQHLYCFILCTSFMTLYQSLAVTALVISNAAFFVLYCQSFAFCFSLVFLDLVCLYIL